MSGFSEAIPVHLFIGAEIELIVIGASSIKFELSDNKSVLLYYYGALEDKNDWLYNIPLCGDDSAQSLVGQYIKNIVFLSDSRAEIAFSEGRILQIEHDDVNNDLVSFRIGEKEYTA